MASDLSQEFIRFTIEQNVLRFGEFKTKAGRLSPYFFDAGLFYDGKALKRLAGFYARAIRGAGIQFDMLFGPAYKGIPLVAGVAIALAEVSEGDKTSGTSSSYSFNRKEEKDHGEGGSVVGAPLRGKVLIVDDVISAGTSVRESVNLIRSSNAVPCGVVIALDRMERGIGALSAAQEVTENYKIRVISIATLDDLVAYLKTEPRHAQHLAAVGRYREQYGVTAHA